jgi:cob(I)alamin adenosyltransferase
MEEPGAFVTPRVMVYLNRLSDLLFVAARRANKAAGVEDTAWEGV